MKKTKTTFGLKIALLTMAAVLVVTAVSIPVRSANAEAPTPVGDVFTDDFEGYGSEKDLTLNSKFGKKWSMAFTNHNYNYLCPDPENPGNTVIKLDSLTSATTDVLTAKGFVARNAVVTFRMYLCQTQMSEWISLVVRKSLPVESYNHNNNYLMMVRTGKIDGKTMYFDPQHFNYDIMTAPTPEDGVKIVESEGLVGRWYDMRFEYIDDRYTLYVNETYMGSSYYQGCDDPGYVAISSMKEEFYVDDFRAESYDKYRVDVTGDVGGTVKTTASTTRENKDVTITATPDAGYEFAGWFDADGAPVSAELSYTFQTDKDVAFHAKWTALSYLLTVETAAGGGGTVAGGGTYATGSSVTLTATPAAGKKFAGWYDGTVRLSSETPYTFAMEAGDRTIEGFFVAENAEKHTVTCTVSGPGMGTVDFEPEYYEGTVATITATAEDNYSFVAWYRDGESVSTETTYTFEMLGADVNIEARFEIKKYAVRFKNGVLQEESLLEYTYGKTVTLHAAPADRGYLFNGWSSTAPYTENPDDSITLTVTQDNISVTANYLPNEWTLTIKSNVSGAGTALGGGARRFGETIRLSPVTNEGYNLIGYRVTGAETVLNDDGTLTLVMPNNDVTVELQYETFERVNVIYEILGSIGIAVVALVFAALILFKKKSKQ